MPMTIETKTSEKGRISYFGNGSQTRLGTIVDGLIGGETYEIINLNGDRKIFAGYTSKTKKEIAAFIKAPKAEIAKAAIENNLPVYRASCLTYTYKFIDAYFTNAIDAHKWLIAQAKKHPTFADGGLVITREISSNLDAELYCFSDKLYEINAADEPEFATYIYEVEGAQYLDYRYNKMKDFAEHLSNCGLSKEQIHQVLIVKCQNEKSSEVGKLVKKFRRANDDNPPYGVSKYGGAQFTFDVQRFATTDIVAAAIENLPDDMKDEVRADYAPYKAEFTAAGHKIGCDNPDCLIDKLTAEYAEAEKISEQRQSELRATKKAVADAKNQADKKYFALTDLANKRARKARKKFLRTANVVSDMMIKNQDGFETIPYLFTARVEFDTTKDGNNTISIVCDESEGGQFTLGRYRTFKQAENAIDLFAEAVKRGDKKFTFPSAELKFDIPRIAVVKPSEFPAHLTARPNNQVRR